jgi:hypothetical protein
MANPSRAQTPSRSQSRPQSPVSRSTKQRGHETTPRMVRANSQLNPSLPRSPSFPSLPSPTNSRCNTVSKPHASTSSAVRSKAKMEKSIMASKDDPETTTIDGGDASDDEDDEGDSVPRGDIIFPVGLVRSSKSTGSLGSVHRDQADGIPGHLSTTPSASRYDPVSVSRPATPLRGRVKEDEDGKSENIVVCVRCVELRSWLRFVRFQTQIHLLSFSVRTHKAPAAPEEEIWSLDTGTGRIILSQKHPIIAKRGSGLINGDTYDYKFGTFAATSLRRTSFPVSDVFVQILSCCRRGPRCRFMKNGSALSCGPQWMASTAPCSPMARQLRARRIPWYVPGSASYPSYMTHGVIMVLLATQMGNDTEPGIIPLAVQEVFDVIEEVRTMNV